MKLSEVVAEITDRVPRSYEPRLNIFVWGKNHVANSMVAECFRKRRNSIASEGMVESLDRQPTWGEVAIASIVVYVTGGPTALTLNVTKHRHGEMKQYNCKADCYCTEEETTVETLHPDNSSYADCFRILREAKKDGVISHFTLFSNITHAPEIVVCERTNHPGKQFKDDGTKGYIGIMREAAAYCLDLRKKRQLKPTSEMSDQDCMNEIIGAGYGMDISTVANTTIPTLYLLKVSPARKISGMSLQGGETRHDFLKKCVEWIREQ